MFNFRKRSQSPELLNSTLYDEKNFYQTFFKDLESCQEEIVIESPYITASRMERLYPVFEKLIRKGVKIHIIEMSWSFANQWIRGVHMFHYRLTQNLPEDKGKLEEAINQFRNATPYLAPLRNVNEHFDDYLLQKGRNKLIDLGGIRVYSSETDNKSYKINWLGYN